MNHSLARRACIDAIGESINPPPNRSSKARRATLGVQARSASEWFICATAESFTNKKKKGCSTRGRTTRSRVGLVLTPSVISQSHRPTEAPKARLAILGVQARSASEWFICAMAESFTVKRKRVVQRADEPLARASGLYLHRRSTAARSHHNLPKAQRVRLVLSVSRMDVVIDTDDHLTSFGFGWELSRKF